MKNIFLAFVLLSSCTSASLQETRNSNLASQTPQTIEIPKIEPRVEEVVSDIPKAFWEKIFFEGINERTDEARIKSLRKTSLAKDDLEVRVWMGFGLTKLEGFILKRINKNWSAVRIMADYDSKKFINRNIKLNEPKSGWEKTWQKLIDAEILTLPDAKSINCNAGATDGFSYVVELKKGNNYRTYMYENPNPNSTNKCREANQILEIDKIIVQEFGIR